MTYDPQEQDEILDIFRSMLDAVTKDGGQKRARGEKPSWTVDPSHKKAVFSHLGKWVSGELRDPDSGVHPLVHAAWRCLAIAWQETLGLSAHRAVCETPWPERAMAAFREESEQASAEQVVVGNRNAFLTSIAGALRRQGLSSPALYETLWTVNSQSCTPLLPPSEVRRIAVSAERWPAGPPAGPVDHVAQWASEMELASHGQA